MTRQNLFSDLWQTDEDGTRYRIFWRPVDARMGATLYELPPGASSQRLHMHFGAEDMFFVLTGTDMPGWRPATPIPTAAAARERGIRGSSPASRSRSKTPPTNG